MTQNGLNQHIEAMHYESIRFVCEICEKVCNTERGLEQHTDAMHPESWVYDSSFICMTCNKGFMTKRGLEQHLTDTGHKSNARGGARGKSARSKSFTTMESTDDFFLECPVCMRQFRNEMALEQHQNDMGHTTKKSRGRGAKRKGAAQGQRNQSRSKSRGPSKAKGPKKNKATIRNPQNGPNKNKAQKNSNKNKAPKGPKKNRAPRESSEMTIYCKVCDKGFASMDSLKQHCLNTTCSL